jgi:hypothetical protein
MEIFRKIFNDGYVFTRERAHNFNINYLFDLYHQYYSTDFIHDTLTNLVGAPKPMFEYQGNGQVTFKHNFRNKDFVIVKPANYTPIKNTDGEWVYLLQDNGSLHQKTFKDILTTKGWKSGCNRYISFILKLVAAKATKPEIMCLVIVNIDIPTVTTTAPLGSITVYTNDAQAVNIMTEKVTTFPMIRDYVHDTQQTQIQLPFDSVIFKWAIGAVALKYDFEGLVGAPEANQVATVDFTTHPLGRLYDCFKLLDYLQVCNFDDYLLKCIEIVL